MASPSPKPTPKSKYQVYCNLCREAVFVVEIQCGRCALMICAKCCYRDADSVDCYHCRRCVEVDGSLHNCSSILCSNWIQPSEASTLCDECLEASEEEEEGEEEEEEEEAGEDEEAPRKRVKISHCSSCENEIDGTTSRVCWNIDDGYTPCWECQIDQNLSASDQ